MNDKRVERLWRREPDEEDELEEEVRAKGKGPRKIPQDIKIIKVDHYPEDMTCCTCGCQAAND